MKQIDWLLSEVGRLRCTMHMSYRAALLHRHGTWYGMRNEVCVLWLLEQGHVDITHDGSTERIHSGQWIFQMPGLLLDQVFSKDAYILSFRFSLLWPTGRSLFHDKKYMTVPLGQFSNLHVVAMDYLKILSSRDWAEPLSSQSPQPMNDHGDVCSLLAYTWRLKAARYSFLGSWIEAAIELGYNPRNEYVGDHRVDRIVAILGQEIGSCTVPYQMMMNELAVSRAHIDRLCADLLGCSPKGEHDRIRFEYAQRELVLDTLSIKQISFNLGFKSSSQFAKWFYRLGGQNPKEARLSYQGVV